MTALIVSSSFAMLPNPQNLTVANNCDEARENLRLAKIGNPLISKDENQKIVQKAKKNLYSMCPSGD